MVRVDRSPALMVMRQFPPEFRAEAVALFRSRPGVTIKSVADDLGINHETLRTWIRADDAQRSDPQGPAAAVGSSASTPEDENTALRRRVRELEEERDILRKAAKYFAGETRW
jgi:transposase